MNFARIVALCLSFITTLQAEELRIGGAELDVTPDHPIRLNGFAKRTSESDGVSGRIWVKALAFANDREGPAVLITTDTLGIPASVVADIADRLKNSGVRRDRLTITATHTHSAPMLRGVANAIFGHDLSAPEWEHITNYTLKFTDALEAVALAAIKDMQPAKLSTATGKVGFAINRRTKGGPTDHDLPVLVVRSPDGKVRAVWFSYACHCVTLAESKIHGDWAGCAMEEIERDFPGSIALASIGCGADQNPSARDSLEIASKQGRDIADEVKRLLSGQLTDLKDGPTTKLANSELAFDTPRTRAEWLELLKKGGQLAYYARLNLMRLDHGEQLPTHLSYPIQTWQFGSDLAAVFLPGEVVVDYGLRIKRELKNAIAIAYANDAPGYIPSERILKEGGYEGGGAMIYYDRPNRFAAGLEQRIMDTIHAQLPDAFKTKVPAKGTEGTEPRPAGEAMKTIRTKAGLTLELVASEPLVQSPVAIDWGADGRLWVCEMFDYPTGVDENWKPGGRIKVLSDSDGDGRYDRATIFLDGLPFPTGVTAWRNGALICAAPDILYAQDTDGDGKADQVEKLFTGFVTDNYQARVNSLTPGLDGWFYGANGLLGGTIRGGAKGDVDLGKRDFRFRPDTREFEPAGGFTQFGRVRDDWGRWFGCENSLSLYHFPLADHYIARNAQAAPPGSRIALIPGGTRCFPISQGPTRYNHPESADRFTAACGLGIYRDRLLGAEYEGNAFTCEPAHNLVSRAVLSEGALPSAKRAADEANSEFLASTDVWFRPVQVRTGPDGALYVVDMYRFLIEHPRWIPKDRMATIDARAGAIMGRIYRVVPAGAKITPVRDLTKLDTAALARALESSSGTERDRVALALETRTDRDVALPVLAQIARESASPQTRIQALSILDTWRAISLAQISDALTNPYPRIREHAVRISERFRKEEKMMTKVAALAEDPDIGVRMQVALSLGEFEQAEAGAALAKLAKGSDAGNPWFLAAIASSAAKHPIDLPKNTTPSAPKPNSGAMKLLVAQMLKGSTASRSHVLAQFAPALELKGHAARGGELFAERCATCHLLDSAGHDVGPNLAALRDKPADYWLKNILDPNAIVEPATAGVILELKNGRSLAGVVKAETATSLTVAAPGGGRETVLRADVKTKQNTPISLMPDGLESGLAAQDLADLIRFLQTAPKSGTTPSAISAKEGHSQLLLTAAGAEIRGDQIVFEKELSNIGYWHGVDDHAAWTVRVPTAGEYDVWLNAACAPTSSGSRFRVRAAGAELTAMTVATGGWATYQQTKIGRLTLPSGDVRLTISPTEKPKEALLDLRSIVLVPAGTPPRWE